MFLKSGSNPLMSNELVIKRIINSYIFPREWHDITKTMTFFIVCLKLHCNILKYHYYVFPKPAEASSSQGFCFVGSTLQISSLHSR